MRDVVASTPYHPPRSAPTRSGGRRLAGRVASGCVLLGLTVAAGIALSGAWSSPRIEVGFTAPKPATQAPVVAAPHSRLVVERRSAHVRLVRDGQVVWRARGPVGCLTGRPLRRLGAATRLVARACVRLRDGAVVTLAARVPQGTDLEVR
jgi:hypothetical protein